MTLLVQDFEQTPASELATLTVGRTWKLSMQVNLQQVPEGTVNALYMTKTNNFAQGPGDQVVAVQPLPKENGYSFMFAIGSVSGNLQHIDESVWPLNETVSIVIDAQDEFTTIAIESSTTQTSFPQPQLAPFEGRPRGSMQLYASGPWFSAPVGILKTLTFQTEGFEPEVQPETQPEVQPETAPEVQPEAQPEAQPEVQPETEQPTEDPTLAQQWIAKRPFFLVTVEDFAAVLSWFEARPEGLDLANVSF